MTAFQPASRPHAAHAPAEETPHVETKLAIWSILGFWAFYYVLNTARMAVDSHDNQFDMLPRRAVVTLIGIALTCLIWQVLRRFEGRPMRTLLTIAFLASIPVAFAYAYVNFTAFYVLAQTSSMMQELHDMQAKHESVMSVVTESAVSWYFFVAAWGVLYVALSYAARVQGAERRAAAYRSEAQVAQLRALRYQINPHFLFNTLNSLSTLVLTLRTAEAERMIMNLSTFFRTSLTSDPAADVCLSDEIDMQLLYLDIEKIRFPDRLAVSVDVPDDLEDARVPGMILQPLVENAIKHGVAKSGRPVTVTIRARGNGSSFHLTVEDDADGGLRFPQLNGVGLANVRDRLATRFDGAASVAFGPRDGGGFRCDLTLPLLRVT
jgi:two-component system LytT family sensor kinase